MTAGATPTDFLVTGGAGFIGSHVVDRLVGMGHSVRVLDDLSTGDIGNLSGVADQIDMQIGDLRSQEDVDRAAAGAGIIIHLGALGSVPRSIADPMTSHDVNATGTLRIAMAAKEHGCQRVVFASSSSIYGDNPTLPKVEGSEGRVFSPYAVTKAAGEEYLRLAHRLYDLETVRLRFFNVFGPRQKANHVYAAVIPKFIDWAKRDELIHIHGDGTQSRDFTYVDNNVDGILAAAQAPAEQVAGGVFNLACGGNLTLLDLIEQITELKGTELKLEFGPSRPGDVPHSHADISALRAATGYEPKISVSDGIRRTWDAYVDERV